MKVLKFLVCTVTDIWYNSVVYLNGGILNIAIGKIGSLKWNSLEGKLLEKIVREFSMHKFHCISKGTPPKGIISHWSGYTKDHDYTYPTIHSFDVAFDGGIFINGVTDNNVFPPKNGYVYTLTHVAPIYYFLNIKPVRWMSIVLNEEFLMTGHELVNAPCYIANSSNFMYCFQPHYSDTRFKKNEIIYSKIKMGNEELHLDIEDNLQYLAHRLMNAFYREVIGRRS